MYISAPRKLVLGILTIVVAFAIFQELSFSRVYSAGSPCGQPCDCSYPGNCANYCDQTGHTATCVVSCNPPLYYCSGTKGTCSCTATTTCPGDAWGGWGACANGFQLRVCTTDTSISQMQTCTNPTNPPGCTLPGEISTTSISGNNVCTGTANIPVTFNWGAATNADSYYLRIDNLQNGWVPCETTGSNPGDYCLGGIISRTATINLPVASNFTWWVSAFNTCGQGPYTPQSAFSSCNNPPATCSTPVVTGSAVCSGGQVDLSYSWPAVSGASTYRVQISANSGFTSFISNTTTAATSFSLPNQASGTYYARVRVETSTASCTAPSAWSATTTLTKACATPTPSPSPPPGACVAPVLSGSGVCSGGTIDFNYSWTAVSGATNYRWQFSDDPGFATFITNTTTSATSTTELNQPSGTYYARVRVNTSDASCVSPSAWSNTVTITKSCLSTPSPSPTPSPTPVPGQCTAPVLSGSGLCTGGQLDLNYSWSAVANTLLYRWQFSSDPAFNTFIINTTTSGTSRSEPNNVPGTYYGRVRVQTTSGACTAPGTWSNVVTITNNCPTPSPAPTCTINLSPNASLAIGDTQLITATLVSGSFDRVDFTTSNPASVTISPLTDSTSPYRTTATAVSTGQSTITATASIGGVTCDIKTVLIDVAPPDPWWQVKDGDVSSGGDVNSSVPSGLLFDIIGTGGYPGVVSYKNNTNLTPANVSATSWLVQNSATNPLVYDYQYFANQVPPSTDINDITSNTVNNTVLNNGRLDTDTGYYWFKYALPNDLSIDTNITLGTKKVILLVEGANVVINNKINLTDGSGFFMMVVGKKSDGTKGNITVMPSVGGSGGPDLEGLYLADNSFNDSTGATQLWVRGSVVAYSNVSLLRDLAASNSNTPAEFFEYAPDQVLLYPSRLGVRRINWKEVAP